MTEDGWDMTEQQLKEIENALTMQRRAICTHNRAE